MTDNEMNFDDDDFAEQESARYGFSYTGFFDKKAMVSEKIYNLYEDAWPNQLEEFITFLEGIYGYPIRPKVAMLKRGPKYNWSGPLFDKDVSEPSDEDWPFPLK